MIRTRNFRAEYAHRIANATARGLSRAQARGHAKAGEPPIRPTPLRDGDRFEAALKLYRHGSNQTAAAKSLKLTPERFSRFLRETVSIEGRGSLRRIIDPRRREMIVISNGEISRRVLLNFDQASSNGEYLNAVKAFREAPDIDLLTPFIGAAVTDAKGKSHRFETRPNVLLRLLYAEDQAFHEIYRLIL